MGGEFLKYYSRKDVQKKIVESSQSREVGIRYPDESFGKRPEVLQYPNEVLDLARNGAVSFHISEERWLDPMQLKPGMSRENLNRLRTGFDLLFDIDCKFIEYSKRCAYLIKELLVSEGIKNVHAKFTGSSGFHIGVPFESLPRVMEGREVKNPFPDITREAIEYVKEKIKSDLSSRILEISEWKEIAEATGKKISDLKGKDNRFNPFSVVEIDSVLISSRHMFRAPYSINEKAKRVSIPVKNPLSLNLKDTKMENVDTSLGFLDTYEENEAKNFFDNIFMRFYSKPPDLKKESKISRTPFEVPKIAIKDEEKFPPCIKLLIQGVREDGRKRGVFILINYFQQMGWSLDDIEKYLLEWNARNYEKLREGYIKSQINWYRKQSSNGRTPGCKNEAYMKGIGVCRPDGFCKLIKTPSQYTLKKIRMGHSKYKNPAKNR